MHDSRSSSRARCACGWWLAGSLALAGWLAAPSHAVAQPAAQNDPPSLVWFRPAANLAFPPSASEPAGAASSLHIGRRPAAVSYLEFDITGVGNLAVRRATLRLYAYETSPAGYVVQTVGEAAWDLAGREAGRKPQPGRVLAASGAHRAGELTQVDLTGFVVADGIYRLSLTTTSDQDLTYAGLEAAGLAPRLFLELGEPEAVGAAEATAIVEATVSPAAASVTRAPPTAAPVPDISSCDVSNLMWTVPGRLLRGGRPSEAGMACLAAAGVDVLVDQRPPDEAGGGFAGQAAAAGLEYINLGIPDDTAPSPSMLGQWLDTVSGKLAEGKVVLIHDAAGRGRMGLWDAVYRMTYGGLSPQAAIDGYYVGFSVPFRGAKIDCGNGGRGQVQALAEIAEALTGQPYYPPADEYGNGWANCPRPAYMQGWDYSTLF